MVKKSTKKYPSKIKTHPWKTIKRFWEIIQEEIPLLKINAYFVVASTSDDTILKWYEKCCKSYASNSFKFPSDKYERKSKQGIPKTCSADPENETILKLFLDYITEHKDEIIDDLQEKVDSEFVQDLLARQRSPIYTSYSNFKRGREEEDEEEDDEDEDEEDEVVDNGKKVWMRVRIEDDPQVALYEEFERDQKRREEEKKKKKEEMKKKEEKKKKVKPNPPIIENEEPYYVNEFNLLKDQFVINLKKDIAKDDAKTSRAFAVFAKARELHENVVKNHNLEVKKIEQEKSLKIKEIERKILRLKQEQESLLLEKEFLLEQDEMPANSEDVQLLDVKFNKMKDFLCTIRKNIAKHIEDQENNERLHLIFELFISYRNQDLNFNLKPQYALKVQFKNRNIMNQFKKIK